MKTLYLDCAMGAAGDMLAAALLELLPDPAGFVQRLNGLGLPGVVYALEEAVTCGIRGSRLTVRVCGYTEEEAHHVHSDLHGITHLVREHLPQAVQADVLAVYDRIAQAESQVHGVPVSQIHFHEVGDLDAVADITAVCLLLQELHPERILASTVSVGGGQVSCAHGILPVPAPATALLLRRIPMAMGPVQSELCTPTGAALLGQFVQEFGPMPPMRTEKIGYGCGKKEFDRANCLRAFWGETDAETEEIAELACNLDDMTPEAIGFALETMLLSGALDAYTIPIGMKKSRPGTMLCVLCRPDDAPALSALLLRHTSTLGVRQSRHTRRVLPRHSETRQTPWGPVRVKIAGDKCKPEYDDVAEIARRQQLSLSQVMEQIANHPDAEASSSTRTVQ